MIVRFGYVAMSVHLKNASPSQTMTVKQFEKITDKEAALRKLSRISISNLENCYRLLKHNLALEIDFFRLSSKLVPLVNHPLTEGWKYEQAIASILTEIGQFIEKHKSSPKEGVNDKRHHDYIDVDRLMKFLHAVKGTVNHLDVMIEAKMKDEALLKLIRQLNSRDDCRVLNGASIQL